MNSIQKEREAFEAATNIYHCIYNADLNYYFSGSKFVGDKAETQVNAGWKAWQAAKAQAIPEGFVVVPKEPTPKMIDSTWDYFEDIEGMSHNKRNEFIYKAMIDEAQEPTND